MSAKLSTPVAFIVFNRPDLTARVFETIRQAKPSKLFVIADGPRAHVSGEAAKCEEVRHIATQVDWPCQVQVNFSDENLGCYDRVHSGLNWVFEQCEEAIILEDDCLPARDFFPFCEALLERYRDDDRIGMISGSAFGADAVANNASYYFTHYPTIWGWACWKRVWTGHENALSHFDEALEQRIFEDVLADPKVAQYWTSKIATKLKEGPFPWDLRLAFSTLTNNRVCAHPAVNLISNIGVTQPGAANSVSDHPFSAMPTGALKFPLKHPAFISPSRSAERRFEAICLLEAFPTGHASTGPTI